MFHLSLDDVIENNINNYNSLEAYFHKSVVTTLKVQTVFYGTA